MATIVARTIAEQEYLATAYERAPEYVDGVLEERPTPTWSHGVLQAALIVWFAKHHPQLLAIPELRYQVQPHTYRLPDLVVVPSEMKPEETLVTSPLMAIEILSPDDRLTQVLAKLKQYAQAGVGAIWVLDAEHRTAFVWSEGGLKETAVLVALGGIKLPVKAVYSSLPLA